MTAGQTEAAHMHLKLSWHRESKQAVLLDGDNAARAAVPRELMVVVEVLAMQAQSAMSWQIQGSSKLQQRKQHKQSKDCRNTCRQNGLGINEQQQGTDLQQSGQAGDQGNVNRGQVLAALNPQPSQAGVHMLLKQCQQIGAAGLTDSTRQPLLGPGLDKRPAVHMEKAGLLSA